MFEPLQPPRGCSGRRHQHLGSWLPCSQVRDLLRRALRGAPGRWAPLVPQHSSQPRCSSTPTSATLPVCSPAHIILQACPGSFRPRNYPHDLLVNPISAYLFHLSVPRLPSLFQRGETQKIAGTPVGAGKGGRGKAVGRGLTPDLCFSCTSGSLLLVAPETPTASALSLPNRNGWEQGTHEEQPAAAFAPCFLPCHQLSAGSRGTPGPTGCLHSGSSEHLVNSAREPAQPREVAGSGPSVGRGARSPGCGPATLAWARGGRRGPERGAEGGISLWEHLFPSAVGCMLLSSGLHPQMPLGCSGPPQLASVCDSAPVAAETAPPKRDLPAGEKIPDPESPADQSSARESLRRYTYFNLKMNLETDLIFGLNDANNFPFHSSVGDLSCIDLVWELKELVLFYPRINLFTQLPTSFWIS